MTRWLASLDEDERELVSEEAQPEWTAPMLATLTDDPFSDPEWLYERKFDGERVLVVRSGSSVRLFTRNEKPISDTYPELAEALAKQPAENFIADGEVVAFDGDVTSFARLQQRLQIKDPDEARASGIAVHFYLFDLIHLDGYSLEKLPLRRRKALLQQCLDFTDPIRFSAHRNETGLDYLEEACRKGWEGLIAKRASSRYRHSRSRDWLKFKCSKGQELVIGGFTAPKGSRLGFGALLVGYYEGDELRYAGKVGTGFDAETLEDLHERMASRKRETSPFADAVKEPDATFVAPDLVAEFGFTEWTRSGKLRHPRFLGLRRDKAASDVHREDS